MADINALSNDLGISWGTEKDIPFSNMAPFISFSWDLTNCTVSLPKEKYLQAIQEWELETKHTLEEVQKLYGKLLHACHIIPAGHAYLTNLEAFMGVCHNSPFCPHYPPHWTLSDLSWWKEKLTQPAIIRPIPGPLPNIDNNTYSDASSETGIRITIGPKWEPGDFYQAGKLTAGTSAGQKQSVSGSSSSHLPHQHPEALTSRFLGTAAGSLKVGGKAGAETDPPMKSSSTFTPSQKWKTSTSIHNMFPAKKIQQMALPVEVSTITTLSSSLELSYPHHSNNTYATSMCLSHQLSRWEDWCTQKGGSVRHVNLNRCVNHT